MKPNSTPWFVPTPSQRQPFCPPSLQQHKHTKSEDREVPPSPRSDQELCRSWVTLVGSYSLGLHIGRLRLQGVPQGNISPHPFQQQPTSLLTRAAKQETPVLAKPISAPKAGKRDFKLGLSLCPSVGNLLCQRSHQARFCLQKIKTTIPRHCHGHAAPTTTVYHHFSKWAYTGSLPTPHSEPLQRLAMLT